MRISLQPAFILHHRMYRETSLLVDVFTQEYGRIGLIARGVRRQHNMMRPLLRPFMPLLISFQGKTDLMTLTAVEAVSTPLPLYGNCLVSGFYLNELLIYVLQKNDPHPSLYALYANTLDQLQEKPLKQSILRIFEKRLLAELGYGVSFHSDFVTQKVLLAEAFYRYFPERGFTLCRQEDKNSASLSRFIFLGKNLLAFANEQLEEEEFLRDAKRLMRILLGALLGARQIHSRKLFQNQETQ